MSRSIRKETTSLALQVNEVGGNEADDHYWRLASFRCSQLRKRSEGQADSSRARSIPTAWSGARAPLSSLRQTGRSEPAPWDKETAWRHSNGYDGPATRPS